MGHDQELINLADAALQSGDVAAVSSALADLVREQRDPEFAATLKILDALGLRATVRRVPARYSPAKRGKERDSTPDGAAS